MEGVGLEAPQEESLGTGIDDRDSDNDDYVQTVVKGKRSKRLRGQPPPAASNSSGDVSGSVTEEEEDMANCLILLASGCVPREAGDVGKRHVETPCRRGLVVAKVGSYECKTCGKCFPSFQALGGHRTSHKKPKMSTVAVVQDERNKVREEESLLHMSIAPAHNLATVTPASSKSRVHECSICGSEFSSGQALGGHMRRHRPIVPPLVGSPEEPKKERSLLSLDLNLPAPSEDEHGDRVNSPSGSNGGFGFANKPPPIFAASALVDCHY